MKRLLSLLLTLTLLTGSLPAFAQEEVRLRYSMEEYESRIKAAWLGKMVGVCTGRQNEFYFRTSLVSASIAPEYHPSLLEVSLLKRRASPSTPSPWSP